MQIDASAERFLWSHNLVAGLQRRLSASVVSLLDMAIVPPARGHPRQAAVLVSSLSSDDEDGEVRACPASKVLYRWEGINNLSLGKVPSICAHSAVTPTQGIGASVALRLCLVQKLHKCAKAYVAM